MLIVKHTMDTHATREDIWNIWQDVEKWNTWDHAVEYSSIQGAFKGGTKGTWKIKSEPVFSFDLTRVEYLKTFVLEVKLFLARIVCSHYLTQEAGKTRVTHQVEIKGPLAFFYAYHVGASVRKNIPAEMEVLVNKAESLRN